MSENDGNGLLPGWTPDDPMPAWAAKLLEDFDSAEVGLRPQIWCKDCREHQYKACGKITQVGGEPLEHKAVKCKDCGQKVTRAHLHLDYVGHAHITKRLLDADPWWSWRPMARDVPDEVMLAAIATGDQFIIQQVINSYPPKLVDLDVGNGRKERVMWGELVIHDEHGNEVVTPGVGDAKGKMWGPDALKEMIGDFLRNAGQRRGLAWKLWAKGLADQSQRERGMTGNPDDPWGSGARAALFDDDAKGAQQQGRRRTARPAADPQPDGNTADAAISPEAQAAADLAWQIAQAKPSETAAALEKLKDHHTKTMKAKLLPLHCIDPADKQAKVKVFEVFGRAKRKLEGLPVPGDSQG